MTVVASTVLSEGQLGGDRTAVSAVEFDTDYDTDKASLTAAHFGYPGGAIVATFPAERDEAETNVFAIVSGV